MTIDIPHWKAVTPAEKKLIDQLNADPVKYNHDWLIASLKEHLQIAVEIELATIPIYLYSYYSLYRGVENDSPNLAIEKYVNEAGGVIMSVAVEEMLHMSLAGNILNSLGQHPEIYLKSPNFMAGGASLPHHKDVDGPDGEQPLKFNLRKFSRLHLYQFLLIELPEAADAEPEGDLSPPEDGGGWDTIGQFYSYIRCLIHTQLITDADFGGQNRPQLTEENYAPNNIDTVYPEDVGYDRQAFPSNGGCPMSAASTAQFPNSDDSHEGAEDLIAITSKDNALQAIATICDQGEGYTANNPKWADEEKEEDSHFYKFYRLREGLAPVAGEPNPTLGEKVEKELTPPDDLPDPKITEKQLSGVDSTGHTIRYNYAENPVTANYPEQLVDLSNLCNLIYQYMLIMTEMGYRVSGAKQKEIFNIGMHKAMIWILDKLIQGMRESCSYESGGETFAMAPTFENIEFQNRDKAKQELLALCDVIKTKSETTGRYQSDYQVQYSKVLLSYNIPNLIADLPNTTLQIYESGEKRGQEYVSFATSDHSA